MIGIAARSIDPSDRIVEITPRSGRQGLGLRALWQAREVVWRFAARSLTLRYRQTALGIAWVALQPVLTSGVLALVFGRFAGLSSRGAPYLLTVYAGLLPWLLFSQVIARGGVSLVSERTLVTKSALPRMALPLSSLVAVTVDLGVALAFFFLLAASQGLAPGLQLLTLPLLMLPLFALCAGCVLIVAAANVYYRDVQQTIPFLLQVGFFASPIAYPMERVTGAWARLLYANPITGQAEAFRWALLGGRDFPLEPWAWSCAVSALLLVLGLVYFRRVDQELADVI